MEPIRNSSRRVGPSQVQPRWPGRLSMIVLLALGSWLSALGSWLSALGLGLDRANPKPKAQSPQPNRCTETPCCSAAPTADPGRGFLSLHLTDTPHRAGAPPPPEDGRAPPDRARQRWPRRSC